MGLILHNTEGSKLNHVYSSFNLLSDSWNNWTDPSKHRVQQILTMPISHLIFSVTLGVTFSAQSSVCYITQQKCYQINGTDNYSFFKTFEFLWVYQMIHRHI